MANYEAFRPELKAMARASVRVAGKKDFSKEQKIAALTRISKKMKRFVDLRGL